MDYTVHGEVDDDRLENMIHDVGAESFVEVHGLKHSHNRQ